MKKELNWFIERIGKEVKASSPKAFNGVMKIEDRRHALHLCHVSQESQGYTFEDIKTPK